VFSQGINQSSSGVDKVNSITNVHLATGRIGKPGSTPFSITGQPNAMGGREVGGLANQLAAHMDFTPDAIDRVGRFWQAPNMAQQPGLKAVELFEAVHDGRIKALWIMATNPAVSLPGRIGCGSACALSVRRGLDVVAAPIPAPYATSNCRPPPGARRTAR
jgi:assimilatory nitrate reductase catalytic subunit